MKTLTVSLWLVIALFCLPEWMSGQTPNLGTTESFAVFTAAGAFNNNGNSVVTGDIGTNVGAFNGFPPGVVIGSIHVADPISAQAATDVDALYSYLDGLICGMVLGVNLGSSQVLTPNIYCIGAAAVLNGDLVLDGEGDPDARFIFQIDGALSTATLASVTLINSASACNVYWQINGAFELGDGSSFVGTLVANGAISLLEGSSLEGRALTRAGAIDMHNNTVSLPLPPDASFITADGDLTFCEGDSVILSGNVGGVWSNGETTFSITVLVSGDYSVNHSNDCGIAISNIISVTVLPDVEPPVITCPADLSLTCNENILPANTGFATATDDCDLDPMVSYSDLIIPGICLFNEEIVRTWVATDHFGNEAICVQSISISDLAGPVITCPVDVTLECTDPIDPSVAGTATATDNCSLNPAISYTDITAPGLCDDAYEIIRTWTATDECDNVSTCEQLIDVIDSMMPTITCPSPIAISCTENPDPANTGMPTATDNCDALPEISYSDISTPSGQCPQNYTISRTWTAADNCANSSQCIQQITVSDLTLPVIICPIDVTVDCAASILPSATGFATATDDCDADPGVDFSDSNVPGVCLGLEDVIRTWTATDACGNLDECIQTITVSDLLNPVITCPVDVTLECTDSIDPSVAGTATATDNCSLNPNISFTDFITPSGQCPQNYTISRTWTAADNCSNSSQCIQQITVSDLTLPVITCPIDVTVDCAASILPSATGFATATDDCDADPGIDFSDSNVPGVCLGLEDVIRTWTATDACGNLDECIQLITISDLLNPVITCPIDVALECTDPIDPSVAGTATATDNCSLNPAISYTDITAPGLCDDAYEIIRTWTATDECDNVSTCEQLIDVIDSMMPTITCPSPIAISCTENPDPANTGMPTATDNCDALPEISYSDISTPSGQCPQNYTISRTWTAADNCSNSSQCIQQITVSDLTLPVIICPIDVTVDCAASILPSATGFATATDDCDADPGIDFSDSNVPGVCLGLEDVIRTWTATDACGNLDECIQLITISDLLNPVITCPIDVTLECTDSIDPSVAGTATATDNCSLNPNISFTDFITPSGQCPQNYTISRTWTAEDNCSNSSQCIQQITVSDLTLPVIICPVDVTVDCAASILPSATGFATANDDCDADPGIDFSDSNVPGVCLGLEDVIRTWTATDACGNVNSCTQLITVFDNIPPVITCPGTITVSCAALLPPGDISVVLVSDNCGGVSVSLQSEFVSDQTCENRFTLTRVFLAEDECGNSNTCSQIIDVSDVLPPTITFIEPILEGLMNGDTFDIQCYGQDPEWDVPTFSTGSILADDLCSGEVTMTYEKELLREGNCTVDGYINLYRLTWTATDICGNSSSVNLFLKLVDNISPIIQGVPDDITLNCHDPFPQPLPVSAIDECLCACIVVVNQSTPQPGCQNGVIIPITWTAIDQCGNVTIETQNITLIDTIGPILSIVHPDIAGILNGTIIEVECNEDGYPRFVHEMDIESVGSTTECGSGLLSVVLDTSITVSTDCTISGFLEERTFLWTVTDLCGNSSTFTFSVRLIDTIPPVWIGVPDTVCLGSSLLLDIEAVDNCNFPYTLITNISIANPCGTGGAIRRKYTATDECGNRTVATAIIIPSIASEPEIFFNNLDLVDILPGEIMLARCNANKGNYTSYGVDDIYVEGFCSELISKSFAEYVLELRDCTLDSVKAIVALTWTVTDICGNSASRSIVATIVDNEPPSFDQFDAEITIGCADSLPRVLASDNCGDVFLSYADTILTTECEYEYTIKRLVTAIDECGNAVSGVQSIHVGGGSGPVLSKVEVVICDTVDLPIVTAYDPCSEEFIDVKMKVDTLETTCKDGLVITRTWSAIDVCGRESEFTQTVIVNDHTPPVISVPNNSDLFPFWKNKKSIVYVWQFDLLKKLHSFNKGSVVAIDDCDDHIVVEFTKDVILSEDCILDGFAERWVYTWIASDACGNADSICVIIDIVDDVAPIFLEFPKDLTIYCEPLAEVPAVDVFDFSPGVTIVYAEAIDPISVFGVTIVTRTWIATDACGNSSQYVQTITWVQDNNIECEIILPEVVSCNSHGVIIHSSITGGGGIASYHWKIVGEKCFIQGGQGTPWVKIYVGWSPVKIILTLTDSTGCVSMCMTTLDCVSGQIGVFDTQKPANQNGSIDKQPLIDNQIGNDAEISDINVWPNPAVEAVNLAFTSSGEVEYTVHITNMFGQTLIGKELISLQGINSRSIDLSQLIDGNYRIQIVTRRNIYTKNLVVLSR